MPCSEKGAGARHWASTRRGTIAAHRRIVSRRTSCAVLQSDAAARGVSARYPSSSGLYTTIFLRCKTIEYLRRREMNEENNKIPLPGQPEPVPDFLKDDKWFEEDVSGLWLDFTSPTHRHAGRSRTTAHRLPSWATCVISERPDTERPRSCRSLWRPC